jgi:hypothetical protein
MITPRISLLAAFVDSNSGRALPVVILADSPSGPAATAKYLRDAIPADLELPDYVGFDFGDGSAEYFTGGLSEPARHFLQQKPTFGVA